jgi:hypothetical protein
MSKKKFDLVVRRLGSMHKVVNLIISFIVTKNSFLLKEKIFEVAYILVKI